MQQEGLGAYFLEALSTDIESLKLFSGIHEVHFEKYHRLLSKRFPFAALADFIALKSQTTFGCKNFGALAMSIDNIFTLRIFFKDGLIGWSFYAWRSIYPLPTLFSTQT
jgi:hypothetical protein